MEKIHLFPKKVSMYHFVLISFVIIVYLLSKVPFY